MSKRHLLIALIAATGLACHAGVAAQDSITPVESIEWSFAGRDFSAQIFEIATERLRMDPPTLAESHYAWSAFGGDLPTEAFAVRYYCKLTSQNEYSLRPCSAKKPQSSHLTATADFGDRIFRHTFDRLPALPNLPPSPPMQTKYVTFEIEYNPVDAIPVDFSSGELVEAKDALKNAKGVAMRFGEVFRRFGAVGRVISLCKILADRSVACKIEKLSADRSGTPVTMARSLAQIEAELLEKAIYASPRKRLPGGKTLIGMRFKIGMQFSFADEGR